MITRIQDRDEAKRRAREEIVKERGYKRGYSIQDPDCSGCFNSDEVRVYLSAWDDGMETRMVDDTKRRLAREVPQETSRD